MPIICVVFLRSFGLSYGGIPRAFMSHVVTGIEPIFASFFHIFSKRFFKEMFDVFTIFNFYHLTRRSFPFSLIRGGLSFWSKYSIKPSVPTLL